MNRGKPKEAGILALEVGFRGDENYVYKVMTNYRFYRELHGGDLSRKRARFSRKL